MGVLTIFLDRVENLTDEDHVGKSDPYVKFSLEQDNRIFDKDYGDKVSSTKSNELSPVYEETITFDKLPSLNNMVLTIKVVDSDHGLDDQMGDTIKINLEKMKLGETPVEVEKVVDKKEKGIPCSPWAVAMRICCFCCCGADKPTKLYMTLSYTE